MTCPKGLEGLLLDELTQLGVSSCRETVAGVAFDADLAQLYRVALWSRLGNRLLLRLANSAGVGGASLKAMVDRAKTDDSFFQKQFEIFKTDTEETMKALFQVAIADGVLTQSERVVLQHFAEKLGMPMERYEGLLNAAEKHVRAE